MTEDVRAAADVETVTPSTEWCCAEGYVVTVVMPPVENVAERRRVVVVLDAAAGLAADAPALFSELPLVAVAAKRVLERAGGKGPPPIVLTGAAVPAVPFGTKEPETLAAEWRRLPESALGFDVEPRDAPEALARNAAPPPPPAAPPVAARGVPARPVTPLGGVEVATPPGPRRKN
jgi:hypothetical protein